MNNRLELNTGVLKEKEENYTSLTELNQLRLFTDDFEIIIEEKKGIAQKEDDNLINSCFIGHSEENKKDVVISSMFHTNQRIAVEKTSQSEEPNHSFLLLGSILIGFMICILVFEITNRGEKNGNDVDVDNQTEQ